MVQFSKLMMLVALLITIQLSSCTKEDDDPKPIETNYNLQPNAGEDRLVEKGTQVDLNGIESGNAPGFDVAWSFKSKPSGSSAAISVSKALITSFNPDISGEYVLTLKTSVGDKSSNDEVVITAIDDLGIFNAKVFIVNATEEDLFVAVNGSDLNTEAIPKFGNTRYGNVLASDNIEFSFDIGGQVHTENLALVAEKNYTIVVTGNALNPEIILHENIWNDKTLETSTADDGTTKNDAINVIHAAPELETLSFHTRTTEANINLLFDDVIKGSNASHEIGILEYKQSATALMGNKSNDMYTANRSILWGQPASDNATDQSDTHATLTSIALGIHKPFAFNEGASGQFITYVVVKNSNDSTGYVIIYINNSSLL